VAGKRKSKKPSTKDSLDAIAPGPCSFCGRTPLEHEGLQFQKGDYRICADCVKKMHRELLEEKRASNEPT
jgi:ClpX C4-type zinc finger